MCTSVLYLSFRFIQLENKLSKSGHLGFGRWQPPGDGSELNFDDHFTGCIDNVQIWSRPFGPSEVMDNWNKSLTGHEKDLMYDWTMDEVKGRLD